MIYFLLIIEFLKIGLFAIGGGLATIPFLEDLTYKYNWFDLKMLANMIAISESTPGPIGINMATFAGINATGILGGIIATLSLVFPSFIIIYIINKLIKKYNNSSILNNTFTYIRPVAIGIIASTIINIIRLAILKNNKSLNLTSIIFITILCALINIKPFKKVHPFFWIMLSGFFGIILKLT